MSVIPANYSINYTICALFSLSNCRLTTNLKLVNLWVTLGKYIIKAIVPNVRKPLFFNILTWIAMCGKLIRSNKYFIPLLTDDSIHCFLLSRSQVYGQRWTES